MPEQHEKAIRICDLTYRYADGVQALAGVSLEIRRAETVAIVGPNGAGKTTLMLHLNGILPQAGPVGGRKSAMAIAIQRMPQPRQTPKVVSGSMEFKLSPRPCLK
ncbi:MAG: ATP-binding cassette domain-containing protein [bacterium]